MRRGALLTVVLLLVGSGCGGDGGLVTLTTGSETTATVPETTAATLPETTLPETTVPETTVPESTVPETSTTVFTDAGRRWWRVPDDGAVLDGAGAQYMWSVASGGPGLVAVGFDESGGDRNAAVWTSVDGVTWERVQHRPRVFGRAGEQNMYSVTAGGPGLVAVGSDDSAGDADAAVWTSVDGITWNRVPHDDDVFGGPQPQGMRSVVAGGPGLVAVGYDGSGPDWDAAVWTSVDGETWERVPHLPRVFGGPRHQVMYSVAVAGPGLVAVGYDGSTSDVAVAAVWTSVDGITWRRVLHDDEVFGGEAVQFMWSVTAGGPGVVAVGYDTSGPDWDAAVWTSVDGAIWERVPHDPAVLGGPRAQSMRAVVAAGPGLVALGTDGFGGDLDAAVWSSPDGITWEYLIDDQGALGGGSSQEMTAATVWGDAIVGVGYDDSGEDRAAAVWISPPPE